MILYIIRWAVCLTLLYSLFGLFMKRDTLHGVNRLVLLAILVAAMVLPLVRVNLGETCYIAEQRGSMERQLISRHIVAHTFILVYLAGLVVSWLRYFWSLAVLLVLIHQGRRIEMDDVPRGVRVVIHPKVKLACSWMRWILMSLADARLIMSSPNGVQGKGLLRHELAHVCLGHSWDMLLCELTCRMLWPVPFAWMLRRDLRDVHEYQADRSVLRGGINDREYQLLLIKKASSAGLQPVVNAFGQSPIKRRLKMMYRKPSRRWVALKAAYLLPLSALAIVAFARPQAIKAIEHAVEQEVKNYVAYIEDVRQKESPSDTHAAEPAPQKEETEENDIVQDEISPESVQAFPAEVSIAEPVAAETAAAVHSSSEQLRVSLSLNLPARANLCVSVTDADVVMEDSAQANILSALLIGSEVKGHVEQPNYYFTDVTERKRQELDLLMLTQGWRRYETDSILAGGSSAMAASFETEQTVSGEIKKNWGKVKEGNLMLFIPKTGYRETLKFSGGNRFHLSGLDFVDGTSILLQAANKRMMDGNMMLTVDSQQFPDLLMDGLVPVRRTAPDIPTAFMSQSASQIRYNNISRIYELPDIEVKGQKYRIMNRMKYVPKFWIMENDPIFDFANTMDILVARLGLNIGRAKVRMSDGTMDEIRCIRHGRFPVTVYLDDDIVTDYALEDVTNISPQDVKQIEYAGLNSYVLYIFLNEPNSFSRFRRYKPLSMATVTQLGYKAPVEFYSPRYDTTDNPSFQLDQRTTLYWNPSVITDSTGHAAFGFWPSSKSKSYRVKVEGITEDGEIIRKSTTIR